MQLANHSVEPVWYFIFGNKQKSSLAAQYALEHNLQHLTNPSETTLKEHDKKGLIVESSAELFRKIEAWKLQLTVIFLDGDLSLEEKQIKKDYECIGRCVSIKNTNYAAFRKELYPKLIIVYGPSIMQNQAIAANYFQYIEYKIILEPVTANQIISKFSKSNNYVFLGLVPEVNEINILESYFHLKIIHLKHSRTELSDHESFFDKESVLVPQLQKKSYFHSVEGNTNFEQLLMKLGEKLCPELIYANVHDNSEREGVTLYVQNSEGLLLNITEIQSVLKRKPTELKTNLGKLQLLVEIVFKNFTRSEIFFTDYPWKPEEFVILQKRTRPFKLFADCLKSEKYMFSKTFNSPIYFLETQRRKNIALDFPFEKQINTPIKYLVVSGPPCVGKTSAAKYISSEFGYKHIEYEPYVQSIKQKLIAPEDGEQLPFHKIIKHFNSLITTSGNNPILIDGFNIDWKDIDNWVNINGPPVVLNLKTDEKELIRRTRRKNEADVAAEVTEEQLTKIKEAIIKNSDWAQQFSARCPLTTIYQIDFTPQLILAQKLLDQILKPRVFLIQDNNTLLYQNIAIRYNLAYFNLRRHSLRELGDLIRKGNYRNVILCNYSQNNDQLICEDFYWIQKFIGPIRYLSIWTPQAIEANDQKLHLQAPVQPEKPKPAEGEQGGEAPPPVEEEGQAKKKVLNIYDFNWTKPGNQKNLSQWFFSLKKNAQQSSSNLIDCFNNFSQTLKTLSQSKQLSIYDKIVA